MGQLPPVLEMFSREIVPAMSEADWLALEKKLFTISDEENIPKLFRPLLAGD